MRIFEGLGEEFIAPRVRAFVAEAFTEATGMTIDDLYASEVGTYGYNSKHMRMYQLKKMLQLVNEMNERDGFPQLTIMAQVANPNGEM